MTKPISGKSKNGKEIHPSGFWNDLERVKSEMRRVEAEIGEFPSARHLRALGELSLINAVISHGGFRAMRQCLGAPQERAGIGHWRSFDNVTAAIRDLEERIGHFPTDRDFAAHGMTGPLRGIRLHHGGLSKIRRQLAPSTGRVPNGHWNDWETLAGTIEGWIARHGHFPEQFELRREGNNALGIAINRRHGGFANVRKKMGYERIVNDTLAAHADALAQIVPTLEANPTVLWTRMKRSWTTRDLDAAVAEHTTTGSLDAFRRLLDGPALPPRD